MTTRTRLLERQELLAELRELLHPGDTITCVLRHVSASGMSRDIDFFRFTGDQDRTRRPNRLWLSYRMAKMGIGTYNSTREALRVTGAGMDMGFHAVYGLASILWPNGFTCIGEGCPSNDHSNGDRDYSPHHHVSGGYALRTDWL